MKIVKKEVHAKIILENIQSSRCLDFEPQLFTYSIESIYPIDTETAVIIVDVEEPETINEFVDTRGISKKELVEWLNKNYK